MTNDGQFRIIVAEASATAAEAAQRQGVSGNLARLQGQLLCGGILVRETTQPANRVQIKLRDSLGNQLVADALPTGHNRAIASEPGDKGVDADSQSLLQVNYTLRNGDMHQGIVALQSDSDISHALSEYFRRSEQITAVVHVECFLSEGQIPEKRVLGFVVQVTPEATPEGAKELYEHLHALDPIEVLLGAKGELEDVAARLLEGHEYTLLANSEIAFGCTCSDERMRLGISTLALAEIEELAAENRALELSCDACGKQYTIEVDVLQQIRDEVAARTPLKN